MNSIWKCRRKPGGFKCVTKPFSSEAPDIKNAKRYHGNNKRVFSNQIYELLNIKLKSNLNQNVIIERCLYILLNEASQCIHENIIDHASEGDIASVFGIGFPAYKGGPFYFMDKLGLVAIESKLLNLEKEFGKRFKPYPIIRNMCEEKLSFYSWLSLFLWRCDWW